MKSVGGVSKGIVEELAAGNGEVGHEPASVMVSDHGCVGGVMYSRRTAPNGAEYEVVSWCPVCLVDGVKRAIPERYQGGWSSWTPVPELEKVVAVARRWEGMPWSLLRHGRDGASNVGTGKTHAAYAIMLTFAERGVRSVFWQVAELVEEFRVAAIDGTAPPTVSDERLLVLDDLCLERATPMAYEQVELLIDRRWKLGAPTVVTTNASLSKLQEVYPRAYSRLAQGYRLEWVGPDYRQKGGRR